MDTFGKTHIYLIKSALILSGINSIISFQLKPCYRNWMNIDWRTVFNVYVVIKKQTVY